MSIQGFIKKIIVLFFCSFQIIACQQTKSSKHSESERIGDSRKCMNQIISLDDSLGKVRNHACERLSLAQTIREYTDAMNQFDYQNCPADFTMAFQKHREAWAALIPIVEKYPDMRGEMHVLFEVLEKGKDAQTFNALVDAIWDTWAEIEKAQN